MNIHSLTVGPIQSNCHLLVGADHKTLVIDPGDDTDRILALIQTHDLDVVGYPLTHGHVDHVSAVAAIYQQHPAPVGIHPLDGVWAFSKHNRLPPFYDSPKAPPVIEREYDDGQVWEDAGLHYKVIFTPGHSPGGVCFYFEAENLLVAGDTLFCGSVGRTDLPGGDPEVLAQSLQRLTVLPDETRVLCGHGPATTIGQEKAQNPFLQPGEWPTW